MSEYVYGISESIYGMYVPPDKLARDYKVLDVELTEKGYVFDNEDEYGYEYKKDGDYIKIFKYLLVKELEEW